MRMIWTIFLSGILIQIENFKVNENFVNEIEKIFEESGVEWKDKEKFLGKEKIIKWE